MHNICIAAISTFAPASDESSADKKASADRERLLYETLCAKSNTMSKVVIKLTFVFLFIAIYSCKKSPEQILERTIRKIGKINTVEQILLTEYYDSANYFFKTDTSAFFFNFMYPWKITGAKYHCPGYYLSNQKPLDRYIYDIARVDTMAYESIVYRGDSEKMYIPIYGSLDALRRCLPNFLLDTTIQITRLNDTLIHKRKYQQIECILINKFLSPGGSLGTISYPFDYYFSTYRFIISKRNRLPYEVIHELYDLHEFNSWWKATTLHYNFKPKRPGKVWDITSNPQNYITTTWEEYEEDWAERLRVHYLNQKAPDWELPSLDNKIYNLNDFQDKLLLIEFWFVGCGGCHLAIPFLNKLKSEYDSRIFDVVGINFVYQKKDVLEDYIRESNIKFLTLNDGQQTAIKYKVKAAPLFLLIKNGMIIYAVEGYSPEIEEKIVELIDKNI